MDSYGLYDSVTGGGAVVGLERKISEFVGTQFAVAMTNCTSAIHAGLLVAGVKRHDEVIVPAYTKGWTISGLLLMGARPVFADIDDTLTLDVEDVKRKITARTRVIIPVHLFGQPCDMDSLTSICREYNLALIEDCAQAFGARINGQHVGSFGVGCFSFGYNKPLSAGEGGVITADSEDIYDRIIFYSQHVLRQHKDMLNFSESNEFAVNCRIHPLTARYLLETFDSSIQALETKKEFFTMLNREIIRNPLYGLESVTVRDGAEHSWYRYSPKLEPSISDSDSKKITEFFADHGCILEGGYIQTPLYRHTALRHYLGRRAFRAIQRLYLPRAEMACRTRIGVALRDK